jgi:hypothetical protein
MHGDILFISSAWKTLLHRIEKLLYDILGVARDGGSKQPSE